MLTIVWEEILPIGASLIEKWMTDSSLIHLIFHSGKIRRKSTNQKASTTSTRKHQF